MLKIKPVLLAGGGGTRLWPSSRKSYPKQFLNLIDNKSLFQKTALRFISNEYKIFSDPIVVTNSDFRFIVDEQLQSIGLNNAHILIEPTAKNTAAAILAASLFAYETDEKAILLAAPSDHDISDVNSFHAAIEQGIEHALNGNIVTFGILPTYPETGYGYLELKGDNLDGKGTSGVVNFFEKPDKNSAVKMLGSKKFLWNSGIFLFQAKNMIEAFEKFASDTLNFLTDSMKRAELDLGFLRLNPDFWDEISDISIDNAIIEKADNIVAVPLSSNWSDLGCWNAVWSKVEKDDNGVAISKNAHAFDCSNTLLRSETASQKVIGLGLDNIIAVAMPDAVLVADKSRAQDIKPVVENLKKQNISQAESFPKDHRPWGHFESLAFADRFQVKRISVKPGAALSLQSHYHRSEHWVVVEGTAKVTVNKDVKLIAEGESVYVPLGAIHKLENPGNIPVVLIEVQTGRYLGEDDIVRYEDMYGRQ